MLEVLKGRPSHTRSAASSTSSPASSAAGGGGGGAASSPRLHVPTVGGGTPLLPERVPSSFGAMDFDGDKRFVRVKVRPTFV